MGREKRQAWDMRSYIFIYRKQNKMKTNEILQVRESANKQTKWARDISLKWGTLKVEMMVIESLNSYIQKSNTNKITNILKYRERIYESNKSHMLKQNRTKKIVRNFHFLPK